MIFTLSQNLTFKDDTLFADVALLDESGNIEGSWELPMHKELTTYRVLDKYLTNPTIYSFTNLFPGGLFGPGVEMEMDMLQGKTGLTFILPKRAFFLQIHNAEEGTIWKYDTTDKSYHLTNEINDGAQAILFHLLKFIEEDLEG